MNNKGRLNKDGILRVSKMTNKEYDKLMKIYKYVSKKKCNCENWLDDYNKLSEEIDKMFDKGWGEIYWNS